ncbi:hypothetical protein [Ruegeria lacuscaerulensis]|uniref:hypothetical protein n=1 Tax=Ruegeria lacuscaerulensis TaxID=55218 RepID=UPI00148135B5|nr:hypothetical protein [Ruegeria lacuscaerulensis]
MDRLEPLFKALPVILLGYGLVRTIGECFEVHLAGAGANMGAETEWQLKVFMYASYIRALDSLLFYAAFAAVVHWLNVKGGRATT